MAGLLVSGGIFTIPLMKRVGYRPDQAGAVEVSSSVNGQLMPPVMGEMLPQKNLLLDCEKKLLRSVNF